MGAYGFTGAFFRAIAGSGVRHVCISPGSRSTPLALSARWLPELRCWVHLDERSAGFFALGLARAAREPVALVCTSGTAAANYLPAVVEASHQGVPLLVLTADRPPELRDWDAGQTIDQLKLYGSFVRWFAELPVADDDPRLVRVAASSGARAVHEALGGSGRPGPVHLNWPFREPLEPADAEAARAQVQAAPSREIVSTRAAALPDAAQVSELADQVRNAPRGMVACGPIDPADGEAHAILAFARAAGWPVLADPASSLRGAQASGGESPVVAGADFLLRSDAFGAAHRPDAVLRIGSTPVSKALRLWLEAHPPASLVAVDAYGAASDPSHLATRFVRADPFALCRALAAELGDLERDPDWAPGWRAADDEARAAAEGVLLADDRLLEPRAVHELCERIPSGSLLYVSNSMPIRHLDACLGAGGPRLRVLANRGANGIDGVTSSAIGAAAAGGERVVLLTGDIAFLHDLGGLWAARAHALPLTIVLLDNDGGGIFSFLPVASRGEDVHFEELFRTRHGLDLQHAAKLFGADYARVESLDHYAAALKDGLAGDGLRIVHVRTDRDASVEQFREMARAVSEAVA